MNLATKTRPWMVASLLAATSVFGQNQAQAQNSCYKGPNVCRPQPKCGPLQAPAEPTVCAYNAAAEINVGIQGEYDFFLTGSFIYWQPTEDNTNVALVNNKAFTGLLTSGTGFQGNFVEMDFKYKPGFKVGLGMNLQNDDWVGYAEYTRLHSTHHASSNGSAAQPSIYSTWGHPFLTSNLGEVFNQVNANYTKNFDFVDLEMWRHYYVGKSLLFRSSWGARGAWIQDSMHVHYVNNSSTAFSQVGYVTSAPTAVDVYQRVHSWAVGPRAGLTLDWLLGEGIRLFGSGYGDLLYTKYKLQDKTVALPLLTFINTVMTPATTFTAGSPVSFTSRDKIGTVRAHLDFEVGFGWGMYFDTNNWHLDLAAAYGWQVFFDQNMFRKWNDDVTLGTNTTANGNVYVQGLTVSARLDF